MLLAGLRNILVIVMLVISLSAIRQLWTSSMNIADRGTNALDRWEANMILVKEDLPINRGLVGYISEENVPGAEYEYWDSETEFLLTQYALAPLVLKKGPIAEWNVVVLSDKDLATWLAAYPGQYEITTIKGKVRIFHNLGNP